MSEEKKKLQRSNDDRILAGVCGGLGEYFNVDPTIIRVLFVLLTIFVGGGIIAYIILWILMPQAPTTSTGIEISDSETPAASSETTDSPDTSDEAPADEAPADET